MSVHLQTITWKKELAISPFHLLIVDHFWHLLSVGPKCSNTINAFFGIGFELTLEYYDSCKNRQCKTISQSPSSTGEQLLPQDLDWSLIFDSFLSRYPSNTDNQIYSNSKTRIWNPILLVLILCAASFQICLWISPCVHQCFTHYHLIVPRKISNLGGLSLVSSWKACLFYSPFFYLKM